MHNKHWSHPRNPPATLNSYWEVGSQDTTQFPRLTVGWKHEVDMKPNPSSPTQKNPKMETKPQYFVQLMTQKMGDKAQS